MRQLRPITLATVSWLALSAGQAAAQEAPAGAGSTLSEIVVTAEKRTANINDVPMSITALGAEQLQEQGIRTGEDLVKVVPSLTYTQTQFGAPVYTLRGVGFYESSLAANPAVSIYVDETPLTYPAMTRGALLDLERVEVLKGPQGTLFGQNSTGGAINYIAAKPTAEPAAGFSLSYGRFNTLSAETFFSGPLSETLRGRVAISLDRGGPWQVSQTRDAKLGDVSVGAGRVLLDWQPTETLSVAVNVNGWIDQSDSLAPQFLAPHAAVPAIPLKPGILAQPVANGARDADWDAGRDFSRDNTFVQASVRADWDIGATKLTSISAYERLTRDELNEADATPVDDIVIGTEGHINSFSQEIRLASDDDRPLQWMVGANYQKDEILDRQPIDLTSATNAYPFGAGGPSFGPFTNITNNDVTTSAVFANASYELTDTLSLEAGVRYTESENRFSGCTLDSGDGRLSFIFNVLQSFFPGSPVLARPGGCITLGPTGDASLTHATLKEDNVSWRLGATWEPTGDTLLYANVSKGYKAGNFPNLSASASAQFAPVTQEELLAYEAGLKQSLFNRTVQLNAAVYYYDYTDKQLRGRILDPFFGQLEALVNIPESHIKGAEVQVQWSPVRALQTSLAASYTSSKVERFTGFNQFGAVQSFAGSPFPYTPKWDVVASVDYRWSATGGLVPFAGASATYKSRTYGSLGEPEVLEIPAHTLVDLRAGVESEDGRWRAFAWGRNVTDEYYWVNALVLNDTIVRYAGRPATYGVTLAYKY